MIDIVGLDFETYSAVDLNKHGLSRYFADPTFLPLIGSVSRPEPDLPTQIVRRKTFTLHDTSEDYAWIRDEFEEYLGDNRIAAHNVGFEQMVLEHMKIDAPPSRFIDSAVLARAAGAAGKLEAAAPQLLSANKVAVGQQLIRLFCIPGPYQEKHDTREFVPDIIQDNPTDWLSFCDYCELDSELSYLLVLHNMGNITDEEMAFAAITHEMNINGWPVDVGSVEEMQRRYLENVEVAVEDFRQVTGSPDLNLNSLPQLKEWCAKRGVRANSFDEKHVASLLKRIDKKLVTMPVDDPKRPGYEEVRHLLDTKKILGGSSLKKLQVILDTVGADGRLRDQYIHCGAGQSLRTTGRSVQLQNLKRFSGEPADMDELKLEYSDWDNTKLAENIRQIFTSSDPQGFLLVGDFASVESRMLAWCAGEDWKVNAYRSGLGVYEMQAAKMFGVPYEQITKDDPRRQLGKTGELSCGYQAGPGAVKDFAAKMGTDLTEAEATKLVYDWRDANPATVGWWAQLDLMLRRCVEHKPGPIEVYLPGGFRLEFVRVDTPDSLLDQHPKARSVCMRVFDPGGGMFMIRFFHGCYERGNSICFYKPSERKTGALWRDQYTDPKTGELKYHSLYGGKLAGILTQSLCREIFMRVLVNVDTWIKSLASDQLTLIGQFHDEIVVDWTPGIITMERAKQKLQELMSDPGRMVSFPLAAEVKYDYRYTK